MDVQERQSALEAKQQRLNAIRAGLIAPCLQKKKLVPLQKTQTQCKRRDSTVKQPCGHAEIHCKQHSNHQHDLHCNEYRKRILVTSLSCTCS